jgi:nucleotide-binding universal stress UspA family protein
MEHAMSYATLMLHLELGRNNAALLSLAADLAERFQAGVIGLSACQPAAIVAGDGYIDGALIDAECKELERETERVEAEFRAALQGRLAGELSWRSTRDFAPLVDYIAHQARAADLIITGAVKGDLFDASRAVDTGSLVMQAGRPVLVMPTNGVPLTYSHALVAWTDSREARRAVADALPLLARMAKVTVVEIAAEADMGDARERVADVVAWLAGHRITATALVSPSIKDDAEALYTLAQDQGADLIVAGAYGHGRLREWVLGGVTRDLLLRADRCTLLSH